MKTTNTKPQSSICIGCRKELPIDHFYEVKDTTFNSNGIAPYCWECTEKILQQYLTQTDNLHKAIYMTCARLNIPYIEKCANRAIAYQDSLQKRDNHPLNSLKIFAYYYKFLWGANSLQTHLDIWNNFADSDDLTKYQSQEQEEFDKRLKELKFQWGTQDTADDYKFLIYEYDKYTKNIELNDIQADLYRDLCLARLEKRKIEEGRMEGDAGKVQSRILLLMNKLKLDNFTNKKELSLSQQSLIEDIAKVEKTEPADYFQDKKKYYDVNKIRQFLEKYVLRPTLNSLCDHRDFDIDMDDAKKYKSGLDVPYE